jgi:hypothetical protein
LRWELELAERLGCASVDELKARITHRDFNRWTALFSLRADEQNAAMEKARQEAKKKGGRR